MTETEWIIGELRIMAADIDQEWAADVYDCLDRGVDRPPKPSNVPASAVALIERQAAEIERLRDALRKAALAMTCGSESAHYCPNCDTSLYDYRQRALAALDKVDA